MHERFDINEIQKEVDQIRDRIQNMRRSLKSYFVNKSDLIDLMITCMLGQEPILLVGKPGTAKSDLVVKFCQAMGVSGDDYFEYMLTKFTEPSEIVGPIDIQELKNGRYLRKIGGKLPIARVAFLDEIFKSNSAILNTLLTVINERKFYQDGRPEPINMIMLFAATNEIPEFSELGALRDRFAIKVKSDSVSEQNFDELIVKGLQNENYKSYNQKPWASICDIIEFEKLKFYIDTIMQKNLEACDPSNYKDPYFSEELYTLFKRIIRTLSKEHKLEISDRKIIKLYKIIRIRAMLFHGGSVKKEDLQLLRYVPDRIQDFDPVKEKVDAILNLS